MNNVLRLSILAACTLPGLGCAGASALRHTQQDYNQAVQTTASEQLLLNIVRLQYRDPPAFMELSSLSTQFAIDSSASLGGRMPEGPMNDTLDVGAAGSFSEKPTITYSPLLGQDFIQKLVSPMEVETLILLTRSGWSVERVLRMAVQDLNGLENAIGASGPTPEYVPRFEEFLAVAKSLRDLQIRREIQAGYDTETKELSAPIPVSALSGSDIIDAAREDWKWERHGQEYVLKSSRTQLVIRLPRTVQTADTARAVLGFSPDAKVDFKTVPADEQGGTVLQWALDIEPRSLLGTLYYLSQGVQVPPEHRDAGLVTTTRDEWGCPFDWRILLGDLFQVCSQKKKPDCAAVAVQYRGHWFYIDDRDLSSKATFALLLEMFELQAGGTASGTAPVLTLPIGA